MEVTFKYIERIYRQSHEKRTKRLAIFNKWPRKGSLTKEKYMGQKRREPDAFVRAKGRKSLNCNKRISIL